MGKYTGDALTNVKLGRANAPEKFKAIDLFSGCGGLSVGLEQAGFEVVAAVEVDALAAQTYRANHKGVAMWHSDIREVNTLGMKRKLGLRIGELDLLAGCPPCQGFSSMRTLNGKKNVADARNDLIFEFLRFVRDFRPKAIMMENVPGLMKDSRFEQFKRGLQDLAYDVNADVLNAKDFAVPQRRRRMILLAAPGEKIEFAAKARVSKCVQDAWKGLLPPAKSGDPAHATVDQRSERIRKLIARIPKNGGSRTDLPAKDQLKCHKKCNGFKDVYGRMAWEDFAPTITGGCLNPSKGRFLHPEENRPITIREAALLQTFPAKYAFPNLKSRYDVALLIGNALPPEFIRRQALQVKAYLETLQGT